MSMHAASGTSRQRRANLRFGLVMAASAMALVLGGASGGWLLGHIVLRPVPEPRVITRVIHRTRVVEQPGQLSPCVTQLKADIAGVYPWMRAHHEALPVTQNGYHPDESRCP